MGFNCSLKEHIRFLFKLPVIAQDFKSREQRERAVLRESRRIGTAVYKTVLRRKGIIEAASCMSARSFCGLLSVF